MKPRFLCRLQSGATDCQRNWQTSILPKPAHWPLTSSWKITHKTKTETWKNMHISAAGWVVTDSSCPLPTQTSTSSPPQHAERLIRLRESSTKLGPLSAASCQGNHSAIWRLFFSAVRLAARPYYLPLADAVIPVTYPVRRRLYLCKEHIRPPRWTAVTPSTYCSVCRGEQQGDSFHGYIDTYLFCTLLPFLPCTSTGELSNVDFSRCHTQQRDTQKNTHRVVSEHLLLN